MNKDHILQEIKRTAKANDGVPLGRRNFAAENLPWLALRKRKGSLERNRQYRSGRDLRLRSRATYFVFALRGTIDEYRRNGQEHGQKKKTRPQMWLSEF
jgi:hypothetical protein